MSDTRNTDDIMKIDTLKKLDALSIKKQDVISIVFIGHIDAGKSTIGGQILNQLNLIDKRTLEKYKKEALEKNRESWYLSWALDTDDNERNKGITTEVGRAYFELEHKRVVLLDAPGHALYVSDMISGANQADVAILIISARTTEFESGFDKNGQTREHIYLSRAGGISKLVVLINKMDEIDWSESRFLQIKKKLDAFLQKIYNQQEIFYIPVTGFKGENILERKTDCKWYTDCSFLEYLDKIDIKRDLQSEFSFTIISRIKTSGLILYEGKIETGIISKKDVTILPRGINTSISAIYDEEDIEIEEAYAGDFVKIKLKESFEQIDVGDIVLEPTSTNFRVVTEFACVLSILDIPNVISPGYSCIIHLRMNEMECKIVELAVLQDKKLKRKLFAKKGEKIFAKIRLNEAIVLHDNPASSQGDMFALRNENLTIALGAIKKSSKK